VVYLCQDETRVGLKTIEGKVITAKGVKPIAPVQWKRDNFWVYGAIGPLNGESFQQEYPHLNGEYFQAFVNWLSIELGERYAILQMDRAPAHMSSAIEWPENIIPLAQPPHSPELNPIERLWQWIKRLLRNQNFPSLEALRSRIQEILKELTPERVISISSYDFILEALFYAASH